MSKNWFKKHETWGLRPVTWQGWLIVITWLATSSAVLARVDAVSHSVSDTLIKASLPIAVLTIMAIALAVNLAD